MTNYKIINSNKKIILYNNYTGIFFEINEAVVILLSRDSKIITNEEVNNFLTDNMFSGIEYYKLAKLYPKITKYALFNKSHLLYDNLGELQEQELSDLQFRLLTGIEEAKNLLEVYEKLGISYIEFCKLLYKFTCFECQVIKVFDDNTVEDLNLYFEFNFEEKFKHEEQSEISNVAYYNNIKISDVEEQFLTKETTISYMLRKTSAILKGRTYGKTLFDNLIYKISNCKRIRILEIGAGLGDVAYQICSELSQMKVSFEYTICDISPALLNFQRSRLKHFSDHMKYVQCDGEEFREGTYDIIICNEVIADLESVKITTELMNEYPFLEKHSNKGYVNSGALRLLKNISYMLSKGGVAVVTEYYDEEGMNEISNQMKDHMEVSINFGVLKEYMDYLGERTEIFMLQQFLNIEDEWVLSDSSLRLITSFLGYEKRFYTKDEIMDSAICEWHNLHFQKISDWLNLFKRIYINKK